ncbi:MAG: MarC family NAAT transporter [Chitinophagales bacterium]|nr:MarC family NAAT transporter [Chitinophagales bacterium]
MDLLTGAFLKAFAALFSIVNPLGAMPVFLSMTTRDTPAERARIVMKASIYLVIILIVSFLVGTYILQFFGISINAMRIAGGFIILNSGFSLLGGDFAKARAIDDKVQTEAISKSDISLTPLAIPMLAGPGSISLLIGYGTRVDDLKGYITIISVIIVVGLLSFLILRVSPKLVSFLGEAGLNSISRIMGFIVVCVGVQYIINGVKAVLESWRLIH